jgi:catechol 2,3-dioxygenase-like lactoylglutathione lyase family enzyme
MPNPVFSSSSRGRFLKRPFPAPPSAANPHTLSFRAKRGTCFFFALTFVFIATFLQAQAALKRPAIFRISWVRLRIGDLQTAVHFYKDSLQLPKLPRACPDSTCLWANFTQKIELVPALKQEPTGLDGIGFFTADVKRMRDYLSATGLKPGEISHGTKGLMSFELRDPENHLIVFMNSVEEGSYVFSSVSDNLIHAGFVVHDRVAMEHFYKDILGFRPYWHGGMKDSETDWVDLQVPDGTDWIEFMLNVPADADKKLLGVMNHIALGVPDIHAAAKQLLTNGMKLTEEPQIGRDGKWQLNLYDPDDTRVELMEFTPVEKPCCSEYTGPHPKP